MTCLLHQSTLLWKESFNHFEFAGLSEAASAEYPECLARGWAGVVSVCPCWVWVRKLKVRTVVRGPWLVAGGDSSYLPPARGPAPGKIGLVSSWARGVRRDPCSRETHPCFIHTQLSTSRILLRPWWSPSESGTGWASLLLQKVSQLGNFQETLWRCYGWWLVRLKRWCDAGWAAWLPGVRSFDASDVVNSWDCHHSHSIVLLRAARQQSEIINWATG